jgi:putative ubiquitin-RnfH superfamily antitoxin RatB of RatAB toxin-antitoxin module
MADLINITVCYATPEREDWHALAVEQGTTIAQALARPDVRDAFAGIDLALHPVGLYGKKRPLETVLRERDRIEIYRPLVADPKESRRRRADKKSA